MKLTFAILLAFISVARGVEVQYAWDAIVEPNLSFYRFQWGPAPNVYTNSMLLTNTTTATVTLPPGTTNYAIVSAVYWVGEAGAESEPTPELMYVVPKPTPKNFRVTTTLQVAESPNGPWRDLWALAQQASPETGLFYRSQIRLTDAE